MKRLLLIFSFLSVFVVASGQSRVYITGKTDGMKPVIDGKPDELCWDLVKWDGGFVQWEPYEGKQPSQPTYFKILYDDNNLYIVIYAHDSTPGLIAQRMSRRDGFEGDLVEVNIDSHLDKLTAYSFSVNAAGVKGDELVSEDGDRWDPTWDPIWYVKTVVTDSGWIAEMQIPFSQLRFGKQTDHTWGLQVMRVLFRKEERSVWQYIPKEVNGWVSKFGELQGIRGINPKRQVEIVPYGVAKQEYFKEESENPFATGKETSFSAGVDGKIAVTNNLTMDFTFNPDFGQVEADPSEVNLTAFETYFQEKRPFFIEGNNIYNFRLTLGDGQLSSDNLFYSRRIGRTPQYLPDLSDSEFADIPDQTTILGAVKLSGKTKNGWSIGIMESLTDSEKATIDSQGQKRYEEVEPMTNYFIARVEKDFNKGNTVIGGMITSTKRKIENPAIDFLPENAFTGGINFSHYWNNKAWMFGARAVVSILQGDTATMTNVQRSPVRYFQRPDANYVEVDSSLTRLAGQGGTIEFGKTGDGHWRFLTWLTWRSQSLELNDAGYLRSADEIQQIAWASYRIWEPFGIFRRMNINFNEWSGWDFGGRKTYIGGNVNGNAQFRNYWEVGLNLSADGNSLMKSDLRGGPYLKLPGGFSIYSGVETDNRRKMIAGLSFHTYNFYNGTGTFNEGSFELTVRPVDAVKISLEPFFSWNNYNLQYIETAGYLGEDRYITARINQTIFGATTRFELNITPDFTIQYYGQPFMATGQYSDHNRITNPLANNFYDRYHVFSGNEISLNNDKTIFSVDENADGTADYTFGNPDFNFLQFRSNLVLRWEYIPGSSLYIVWSQGRTDESTPDGMSFTKSWNDLFAIHPQDVFLIKLSYRIAL